MVFKIEIHLPSFGVIRFLNANLALKYEGES